MTKKAKPEKDFLDEHLIIDLPDNWTKKEKQVYKKTLKEKLTKNL
jgi:hypothetical protein|tara:strand:- start:590 stop:724 length:135 start_codon:yes stop_codon:yes gene_type:complete